MKERNTVGIVGCGYWGPNLVRNFKSLPNCHVKMMCDLNEGRLQHMRSLYPDVEGVMNYDRLLQDEDLDAVIVAAPVKHHFPLAKGYYETSDTIDWQHSQGWSMVSNTDELFRAAGELMRG